MEKNNIPVAGCVASHKDIRTFAYPAKATYRVSGGEKYQPEDIEYQGKIGICTANNLTQNARKALGIKFSRDFQYLMQKIEVDSKLPIGWDEGSSIFSSLKVAKNIGLLPEEYWTHTTEADRQLPYDQYIAKLRAIPAEEIERLKALAAPYKIKAYAVVDVAREDLARAIMESKAGILARFEIGREWYTDVNGKISYRKEDIEPLRPPANVISGHAVTLSNFAGLSFRLANLWGKDWADDGTAYFLLTEYKPTEAWAVFYNDVPPKVEKMLDSRESIIGKIMDLLQQVITLLGKLK